MAKEKDKKESFGGVRVDHFSPAVTEAVPKAMNIHMSFAEALKLQFFLSQALARINSYNRSKREGKYAGVNVCVYPHKGRITINEGRVRRAAATTGTGG